ncbi:hypothetical protein VTH06DRAFT_4241 [Thermothelomyces fergusii]
MAGVPFRVPQVSQAEMAAFHDAHFSKFSRDDFEARFLRPVHHQPAGTATYTWGYGDGDGDEYYEEEEQDEDDDGLGYYPDGVKRTLTDEQIAIFRHSELEALRRARESSLSTKPNNTKASQDATRDLSEGEISSATPPPTAKKSKKRRRGKSKNKANNSGGEPIDLRKRTWDVVDKGLPTLDYGEDGPEPVETGAFQRRRISYED